MLDKNLVTGFTLDTKTRQPDCIACTESKQMVQPFGKNTERKSKSGDLTHIDLWGKYSIPSINENQYYILFVDDSNKFSTTKFLKQKSEATQHVKGYITYLKTHEKHPKVIWIDRGREFINKDLKMWCQCEGIEIQMTAPYSPSQNGVAKQMN